MLYLSLFSGIGGFDRGFDNAGMTCVAQVEIDAAASKVLARHWPGVPRWSDVKDFKYDGPVDLICGGFPCQDVSVAGRRAGLDGRRSGLWFEYRRLLEEIRPDWAVIENVPGLLSSNGGRDMGTVLGGLGELGYGYAYRVLDAQFLGVPQRRRRVFIVACASDWAAPAEVLLESDGVSGDFAPSYAKGQVVSALTQSGIGGGGGPDDNAGQAGHLIVETDHGHRYDEETEAFIPFVKTIRSGARNAAGELPPEVWEEKDLAPTLNTFDLGETRANTLVVSVQPEHGQGSDLSIKSVDLAEPITATESKRGDRGTRIVDCEFGVRRLTPLECERLQGFPDEWTESQADSPRYKQLGNAVAVPCAEWIAKRIMKVSGNA